MHCHWATNRTDPQYWLSTILDVLLQVGPLAYHLKLPHGMRQLHPVFNVVKLSTAPEDPILERKSQALLPSIVVDGEEEWEVEEILNSCWYQRRFQFLVKWKGFSREHNSWEIASDIKVLDLVVKYYWKHLAAPRHIHQTDFNAIFNPGTIALRRSNLEEGVNVRGPLIHDPKALPVVSQHNFIVQPLVTKEWNARTF